MTENLVEKLTSCLKTISGASLVRLGACLSDGKYEALSRQDLARHCLVLGATGRGKTKLLVHLFQELTKDPEAAIVVFGALKRDLYEECLVYCVKEDLEGVELFSPHERRLPAYNPLKLRRDESPHTRVSLLMEAIARVFEDPEFWTKPRLTRWLRNTLLALIQAKLTLAEARFLLSPLDDPRREAILELLEDEELKSEFSWLQEARSSVREELVEAAGSRLRALLSNPPIRAILTQEGEDLIAKTIEEGRILLVDSSVGQGLTGSEVRLLGAILLNDLLHYALARRDGRPIYLIIDEAGQIATETLATILDLGRGLGLHLILAGQHLGQFAHSQRLLKSVLTNTYLKVLMGGLSYSELEELVLNAFTFDLKRIKLILERTFYKPIETTRTIVERSSITIDEVLEQDDELAITEGESVSEGATTQPSQSLLGGEELVSKTRTETYSQSRTYKQGGAVRKRSRQKIKAIKEVPFITHEERKETSSVQFWPLNELTYQAIKLIQTLPPQYALVVRQDSEPKLIKVQKVDPLRTSRADTEAFKAEVFEQGGYVTLEEAFVRERERLLHLESLINFDER